MTEFSDYSPIDPSKNIATKPHTETKKQPNIYDVTPIDGKYQVTLPGLISYESEYFTGTITKIADTLEEANKIAIESKQKDFELFEQISLKKTLSEKCKIETTPDGKYLVSISQAPSNLYTEQYLLQVSGINFFESWIAARDFYLKQRESDERVIHNSLLDIQLTDKERIAFSEIDSFNPDVAPSREPYEIPECIQHYLLSKSTLECSGTTYQNTLQEKNWDRKLISLVSLYIKTEGKELAKKLEIKYLDNLTPKQAIELSTQIVIDYSKYNDSYTKTLENTKADESTVWELLSEGLREHGSYNWQGNGVCRNFADSVKAVFEALKKNQTQFSLLNNTYCCFEGGRRDKFAPERKKSNLIVEIHEKGHAWNTFITLSKSGAANVVIIDATWAKQNLETKVVEGLDYTLTRMEPTVYTVGITLNKLNNTPDFENQFNKILSYYATKIENPGKTGGIVKPEDEKGYYSVQALRLIASRGIPKDIPKTLVKAIGETYQKTGYETMHQEIETIYKIWQKYPDFDIGKVLKAYTDENKIVKYNDVRPLVFENDDLQKLVIEKIKNFPKVYHTPFAYSILRIRVRELTPELLPEFSPITNPEDAAELIYLLNKNSGLSQYVKRNFDDIDKYSLSEEGINNIYNTVYEWLRERDPKKFDEKYANLDIYQLFKQYKKITDDLI